MEANVNSMSIKINWHQNLSFGSSKPLFFLYYIPRNTLFEFVFWLVSPTKRILRGYTKVLLWWLNVLLPTSNNNQTCRSGQRSKRSIKKNLAPTRRYLGFSRCSWLTHGPHAEANSIEVDDKWWQTTITRSRQLKCEHLYAFKDLNLLGGACEQKLTNT